MKLEKFELSDRYTFSHGDLFLSGIQALVRLCLEQSRHDRARGLNTAGYVTGYRGSPLAGLDSEFLANRSLLEGHKVKVHPAVNEELAATALSGTQQVGLYPGAQCDGVFGMWYGKAPGLDRACDALRHGNYAGASPKGGVLVVVGDDHNAKSSTVASYSETAFCDLDMPVLVPASVADVIDYGLYGWALSRFSGCFVGLVALADTMDSAMTLVRPERFRDLSMPSNGFDVHIRKHLPFLEGDFRLVEQKLPAVRAFVDQHPIDRIFGAQEGARTGIVASGRAYALMREALDRLGFMHESDLAEQRLRVLKVGMAWPLHTATLHRFAEGLQRILVIEEGRPFIEHQIRSALYGTSSAEITAKLDAEGVRQLSDAGELSNAAVFNSICRFLGKQSISEAQQKGENAEMPVSQGRKPLFCAGCPHNRSTRVPEGSRALAGIGCHAMASWLDRETDHFCQMGGEGVMWLGQAPFTEEQHIFANLGDGTYFHSGVLAIRAAVASGVNITYKLLYNHAVAMTGGQPIDGELTIPSLVSQLKAEGVSKIVLMSDDVQRTKATGVELPVLHRDHLDQTQHELRDTPGTTVLLYDQSCATELRRKRKRGLVETPARRAYINQEVCEGCGDCSVQSSCVAVEPAQTELGTKRHINQSACNIDLSCVRGFCPSFVLVEGGELSKGRLPGLDLDRLIKQTPLPKLADTSAPDFECNIGLAGIGGGGISTTSAILGVAAHMDGLMVKTLDMTGLAQKGGAVTAHVRLSRRTYTESSPQMPEACAHVLIGVDLLTATSSAMLKLTRSDRTSVFVNTNIQNTIEFVFEGQAPRGATSLVRALDEACRQLRRVPATSITEKLLGDGQMTNMLMLGYAWQSGEVPVTRAALHRAIQLNGKRVADNIAAFECGRIAHHDSSKLSVQGIAGRKPKDIDERMAWHRTRLIAYQDEDYADRHQALVERVRNTSCDTSTELRDDLVRIVADSYAKLLAYKDEFEVARLYSGESFKRALSEEFSGRLKLKVLMAPPFLPGTDPSTGRPRKRAFGSWIFSLFALLARLKWLRRSRVNPFGWSAERRLERELITEFESTVETLCQGLTPANAHLALSIAGLADQVRGFGPVKLKSVQAYRAERELLLKQFLSGDADMILSEPAQKQAA